MKTDIQPEANNIEHLNPEQMEAVTATEGRLRIIAGPGTGKTRTLIYRLRHLICACNVNPENILTVTFTNKAARELGERARKFLPFDAATHILTFHGFCFNFLRNYIQCVGYPHPFPIMDREDQEKLIKEIYAEMDISEFAIPVSTMLEKISKLKADTPYVEILALGVPSDALIQLKLNNCYAESVVFTEYLRRQRQSYALDFDDMLYFTLHILRTHPSILTLLQNQFKYIQVDEFQDVNQAQFDLVALLQGLSGKLCVVGDPDQTIYTWRGSDISFFLSHFDSIFPDSRTIVLKTNYRSISGIIESSNMLIRNNINRIDKPLEPVKLKSGGVSCCKCRNIFDEAAFISEAIQSLQRDYGARCSDIAILYRSSHISGRIENELLNRRIPYRIVKGTEFVNRQEIRDALAFLKLLAFEDDLAFLRIINRPSRGIGPARIRDLKHAAKESGTTLIQTLINCRNEPAFRNESIQNFISVYLELRPKIEFQSTSTILDEFMVRTGYEEALMRDPNQDRIENLRELKRSVSFQEQRYGGRIGLPEYLAEMALFAEVTDGNDRESVQLMTIHSAKGLEFPYVIVAGMNDGIFPSSRAQSQCELEEERRLAYVAFTRAMNGLILTCASGCDYNNIPLKPSRFIAEISGSFKEIKRPSNYFR